MTEYNEIYAIDFDGTLIHHPPNLTFEEILTYPPADDAVRVLNYLYSQGKRFYVLTARSDEQCKLISIWLEKNGLPPFEVTNIKKPATMYIDDRAYRFTNWEDVGKLIK